MKSPEGEQPPASGDNPQQIAGQTIEGEAKKEKTQ